MKQQDCPDYPVCSVRSLKSLESAFREGQGAVTVLSRAWLCHSHKLHSVCSAPRMFNTKGVIFGITSRGKKKTLLKNPAKSDQLSVDKIQTDN